MIVIDIDKIKAQAEAKKQEKPTIEIILPEIIKIAKHTNNEEQEDRLRIHHSEEKQNIGLKDALILDLDNQERDVRIERAKQSNKYLGMIERGASQSELSAHYQLIERISNEIFEIYEKRNHVLRFGRLPEMGNIKQVVSKADYLSLKELKRSLENRRHKLKVKIRTGEAKNSPSLADWKVQLDMLDAQHVEVLDRLRELRHE